MTTTHETKAARLMVLYRLRLEGQLSGLSDIDLAAAFQDAAGNDLEGQASPEAGRQVVSGSHGPATVGR